LLRNRVDSHKARNGAKTMHAKRVPKLNWPTYLFRDASIITLTDEEDQDGFREVADFGARAENIAFPNDQTAITRFHYTAIDQTTCGL
jgi:hypothetical protein